jgi:polyisoprenyl-phosphate glycosyltransferase
VDAVGAGQARVLILIPVFNDWSSVARLLTELDAIFNRQGRNVDALLVDDASSQELSEHATPLTLTRITSISILRLRRNVGHQRAIAIGLAYAEANDACDVAIVMDGDGEDKPEDVPRLMAELERRGGRYVVFAERTRRSEGIFFVTMYGLYRAVHWLLTGERVRVGNFSAVPAHALRRLTTSSDLWNHYAAAVFKSRVPYCTIPTTRGERYSGTSHMNYVALVTHGLSAMSVFGERIGVRLIVATLGFATILLLAFVAMLSYRLVTGGAMPNWTVYAVALLVLVFFQALSASLSFVFIILGGRDSSTFLPLRDYSYFVHDVVGWPTERR